MCLDLTATPIRSIIVGIPLPVLAGNSSSFQPRPAFRGRVRRRVLGHPNLGEEHAAHGKDRYLAGAADRDRSRGDHRPDGGRRHRIGVGRTECGRDRVRNIDGSNRSGDAGIRGVAPWFTFATCRRKSPNRRVDADRGDTICRSGGSRVSFAVRDGHAVGYRDEHIVSDRARDSDPDVDAFADRYGHRQTDGGTDNHLFTNPDSDTNGNPVGDCFRDDNVDTDLDADVVCHGDYFGNGDSNGDQYTHTHFHADPDRDLDPHGNGESHTDRIAKLDVNLATDDNCHGSSVPLGNRDGDGDCNGIPDSNSIAASDGPGDADPFADADPLANSNGRAGTGLLANHPDHSTFDGYAGTGADSLGGYARRSVCRDRGDGDARSGISAGSDRRR